MARTVTTKAIVLAPGVVSPDDMRTGVTPSTDRLEGVVPTSEPNGDAVTLETADDKLTRLRKYLRDYIDLKSEEIEERREALKYYHDKQWTADELKILDDRKQPPIVFNRIKRKINGVIGLLERLRQDPKAYPRTPEHIDGADVATQCVRYGLDAGGWEDQLSETVLDMCTAGVGGFQLTLEATDDESWDPLQIRVAPETYFYDPRSVHADFSDARYQGVAKWMARDEVLAFLPEKKDLAEESYSALSSGGYAEELDPDKEPLWWDGEQKKVRIVEVWYRDGNMWKYCVHTGTVILDEGDSPFTDGKGKSTSPFSMQTCNIDEKGQRYGFVRTLKGPQDELNHMHSKATHSAFAKQITVTDGLVPDIEVIRAEAHRPDGVVALPDGQRGTLKIEDNSAAVIAAGNLMETAANEIENFGPNTATAMGMGDSNKSGRAIALLQQAAISELGLFIVRVRAMKKRVYTLTWEAIRQYWTAPRFVRVTDDEDQIAFLGINQPRTDDFGNFIGGVENPIGKVMVDFVLDEGPDTVTQREDGQMALSTALSSAGAALPPQVHLAMTQALMEMTNLPSGASKRIKEAFEAAMQPQQPDPMQMRGAAAEVAETEAGAMQKGAAARKTMAEADQVETENSMNRLLTQIAVTGGGPQLALPL